MQYGWSEELDRQGEGETKVLWSATWEVQPTSPTADVGTLATPLRHSGCRSDRLDAP